MLPKTLDQLQIRVGSVRGLSEVINGVSNVKTVCFGIMVLSNFASAIINMSTVFVVNNSLTEQNV
jgi:hypothetical protein